MIRDQIVARLLDQLEPYHLDVENESHQHAGPATESHFRVVIVSDHFESLPRIQRHRKVNEMVKDLFEQGLHAFSILPFTRKEWEEKGGDLPASPPCAKSQRGS